MPRALRVIVALIVTTLLLGAVVALATEADTFALAGSVAEARISARIVGQAGDPDAVDPCTGLCPEDPPYTASEPIFNPQLEQAPKDSVTWNPLWMHYNRTFDENYYHDLYHRIKAGGVDASEKVCFRMWYQPWHWDKDLNASGELDIHPQAQVPYTDTLHDEWYPAVMEEFTYMLLQPYPLADEPRPVAGRVGETSFVFPVGMRQGDLSDPYGYGLTSLDGNFDDVPDIVHVESELTLFEKTLIAADFDGNGYIDPLDLDGAQLNGNELAILRLDTMELGLDGALQFLDHRIVLQQVYGDSNSVSLKVWYTGDLTPHSLGAKTISVGDMLLAGSDGPVKQIVAVANGGPGTNMCQFPTGPFFAYLDHIDPDEPSAFLMVGRALGAAWSGMEYAPNQQDRCPGDPWFLKRFYVDGHEYNVVAIKTEDGADIRLGDGGVTCSIDQDGDGLIDTEFWPPPRDLSKFKFITIRTPIPKASEYEDPGDGYLIQQHSVRLQAYGAEDYLSVMPPYNYEHYVILDVQAIEAFTCKEEDVHYYGSLVGPVPPIQQKSGDYIPYRPPGITPPTYEDVREMHFFYVEEDKNDQFLGELKEKYGEHPEAGEFWYVEQWHTLPWKYTEFVLPDLTGQTDLYLLTSSFLAPQSEYVLWTQNVHTDTTWAYNLSWDYDTQCWLRDDAVHDMPDGWKPQVKFWFDPAEGGKKYKSDTGLRVYGFDHEGPGNRHIEDLGTIDAPITYPVEVWPYTDPWAPFNPQLPEAPPKDSLTLNPAYMSEENIGDDLVELYRRITIREGNAREKVFVRMWYEPLYVHRINEVDSAPPFTPTSVYSYPAVVQEFTYMYLDTQYQPAHGQPGSSQFAFPMATGKKKLPAPGSDGELPTIELPSFGYGLTTFDANFDGNPQIVQVHSEQSLAALTRIQADFDGDGQLDLLDEDSIALNGNEMVVFVLEDVPLDKGDSIQFLDHMVTLLSVSPGQALLKFWDTGGGVHYDPGTGQYSLQPDYIGTMSLLEKEMAIANRAMPRRIPKGSNNLGRVDGAWFVFVKSVDHITDQASLTVGRALGHTHTAMGDGRNGRDMKPGDPWYLKRFYVDGHEYNVVAVRAVEASTLNPGDELYEFKYITIRTPVFKKNFVDDIDSQKLEGYTGDEVLGVDTSIISVMPPFNFVHTCVEDIQALREKRDVPTNGTTEEFVFANDRFRDGHCRGDPLPGVVPCQIRIVEEDSEPQYFGELKELYYEPDYAIGTELWQTEQWHTVPDEYTDLELPTGQKYLLTSNWESEMSRAYYYGCNVHHYSQSDLSRWHDAIPAPNTTLPDGRSFFSASEEQRLRVKFLYDSADPDYSDDVYVNTWQSNGDTYNTLRMYGFSYLGGQCTPGGTGAIIGTIEVHGRLDHSGVAVGTGAVTTTTDSDGHFALLHMPEGTYTLKAELKGYIPMQRVGVSVEGGVTTVMDDAKMWGGDTNDDEVVDVFDLVRVARRLHSVPPSDFYVDLNQDGEVNVQDLVIVARGLHKDWPAPWEAEAASALRARAAGPVYVRVSPEHQVGEVGELLTVTLQLEQVSNLFGVDVQLTFDPSILQVEDADPDTRLVQITPGGFPDLGPPDMKLGMVFTNTVDNEMGVLEYAVGLLQDTPPAVGSGTLCTITFQAKALGYSALDIILADLADPEAQLFDNVITVNGSILIPKYRVYLPLIRKAGGDR